LLHHRLVFFKRINNTMTTRLITIVVLLLSIIGQSVFAEKETTPLSSIPGRHFNMSYLGNALTITTTTPVWFYQFAGIKSLTAGFNFLNCTSDNGLCLFSVSDTVIATATLRGPATQPQFKLCLNGLGNTYSCESFNMGDRFAYVVNQGGVDSIFLCPMNFTNGLFGACTNSNATNLPLDPYSITLNRAGTIAYVGSGRNGDPSLSLCPINSDGTLTTCSTSTGNNTFDGPSSIALNNAGSIAYVANSSGGNVSVCPINTNGSFGICNTTANEIPLPVALVLNSAGSIAYVTDTLFNTIFLCPINANGSFGACSATAVGFNSPSGLVLKNTGSIAYVTNRGDNTVSLCPINADGSFGTCTTTGNGFDRPVGIALNNTGSIAYVTNRGDNTVSLCPINADGSFGTCAPAGDGFDSPIGVALF